MLVFDLSSPYQRIRARGKNRIDFVHRMSTGNLLGIAPGAGRPTVFTTPIARIVDYAVVLAFEDSLLILSGAGEGKLERWLRKYIFFNDDVQLTDESDAMPMVGLYGAGADDFASGFAGGLSHDDADAGAAPAKGTSLYAHRKVGQGVLVNAPPLEGAGYYLLGVPVAASGQLAPLSQYHDLRIRAGYPAAPYEINDAYIPLEAGMTSAISFNKGCYIGQEIIARMESRGQLAKRLMKLDSEGILHAGDSLQVDGAAVGNVTSVTMDGHAALGYVRAAFAHEGQQIHAGDVSANVRGLAQI
jgi:aminomethyltransferase